MGIGNSVLFRGGQPRGVTRGAYLTVVNAAIVPGIVSEFIGNTLIGSHRGIRPYQPGTNGQRRMIMLLMDDFDQGQLPTTAFTILNQQVLVYFPIAGEKIYMPIDPAEGGSGYGSGFGPNLVPPLLMMVKSGTGTLVPALTTNLAVESIPFLLEEEVDYKVAADEIVVPAVCTYTGY